MKFSTKRCMVRPFTEADLNAFMEYRNNETWMQYQGFKGLTKQEYREQLLNNTMLTKGRQFAVCSKGTRHLLGDVYVRQEGTEFWIGYTISPFFAKQGYMYEVVLELIAQLKQRGATAIKAGALPENTASLALLKKLGFMYTTTEEEECVFVLNL